MMRVVKLALYGAAVLVTVFTAAIVEPGLYLTLLLVSWLAGWLDRKQA
jgi:hypothetical protein